MYKFIHFHLVWNDGNGIRFRYPWISILQNQDYNFHKSFIIYQISKITDVRFCGLVKMWSWGWNCWSDFGFGHLERLSLFLFQSSNVSKTWSILVVCTKDATLLFCNETTIIFQRRSPSVFIPLRRFSIIDRLSINSVNWFNSISNIKIKSSLILSTSHNEIALNVNFCIVSYKI